MKTNVPKVCLGCFCEWEEEGTLCPHCGFDYENKQTPYAKWNAGEVLEQRYLVGQTYLTTKDFMIWRMYDNILSIPVFVLYGEKMSVDDLAELAQMLEKYLKILAVKQIDQRDVLLCSMENRYMEPEVFKGFIKTGEESLKEESGRKEIQSKDIQKEDGADLPPKVLKPKTVLDKRYEIIKCLGIGGFGISYLCEDSFLHRKVAVKEYFPEQWAVRDETYVAVKKSSMLSAFQYGMKSFAKEIQITAKFMHTPNIVTIYDAFEANDTIYMVMEYIEGISIGREFRQREYKPYTPKETAEIIKPVLKALEVMHETSIIHSDISPGNMIRDKNGDIVLIDLGAAKYVLDSQPVLNAAFLKIDYAAPEQYQTAKEGVPKGEGPWTDIYAIGATMYYLLTGQKPVDVITRLSSKKSNYMLPKKCKLKKARKWLKLINHAAALDRKERIASAALLGEEMEKLLK